MFNTFHTYAFSLYIQFDSSLERRGPIYIFKDVSYHEGLHIPSMQQGSQNFKIPGSPSGRYSSDFGSPKINLTSPNKKKTINVNQKHFQYTNIKERVLFYYLQAMFPLMLNLLLSKTFLYWADISGT